MSLSNGNRRPAPDFQAVGARMRKSRSWLPASLLTLAIVLLTPLLATAATHSSVAAATESPTAIETESPGEPLSFEIKAYQNEFRATREEAE